jgi:hypothetical protein
VREFSRAVDVTAQRCGLAAFLTGNSLYHIPQFYWSELASSIAVALALNELEST